MVLLLLFFLTTNIREITTMKTEVITTKTGKVQGVIVESSLSRNGGKDKKLVQRFLNIPYAEPPVGKLRFAEPQPKNPWNGTLSSTDENLACLQVLELNVTEDCLILNIWTPHPPTTNTPVMVWIHGGGFWSGHGNFFLGQNFVAVGEVILVTINYRLSLLGFLYTGDERIKGNFGLFDQRLAFKWIKENIASFGGNPQSITIFGGSAGAASVSAHLVSKKSWPYFNRAILQSGTLTTPWGTASKVVGKHVLGTFLQAVGCRDNERLLECLRTNVTVKDLHKFYPRLSLDISGFWPAPNVDGDFLTNEPQKLMDTGEVKPDNVILGITKDEMFFGQRQVVRESRNITFFVKKFEEDIKRNFQNFSSPVFKQALKLYQPACISSFVEALRPLIEFETDKYFACPTSNEAKLLSQILNSSNVYLYQYSYPSPVPSLLYPQGTFGFAAHAIDLTSVFGHPINNPNYPSEDKILSMRLILYWTNFAKTGDPNSGITKLPVVIEKVDNLPKWPKYTNSSREYLDMESLSRMTVRTRLRETHCDFLRDPEGFTRDRGVTSVAVRHIAQVAVVVVALVCTIEKN